MHIRILTNDESRHVYQGYHVGTVLFFDEKIRRIGVSVEPEYWYDGSTGIDGHKEVLLYSYDDVSLRWFPPTMDENNKPVKYPYNMRLPSPVIYEEEIAVPKPKLEDAVGYRVRFPVPMQFLEKPEEEDGDAEGKVVDFKLDPPTLLLSCEAEDSGYELVSLPYTTDGLVWYSHIFSDVAKPSPKPHIKEALHYKVHIPFDLKRLKVVEQLQDDQEIGWMPADILEVDESSRKIKINYDNESNEEDIEIIKFDIPVIRWFPKHKIYI